MRVSLNDIRLARETLTQYLEPTPLLYNAWLSEILGCQLYLKLENMHPIGSFKIRGATYRISRLSDAEKKRGVIAASAGNHAQGVAWGSRKLGINALIVMPKGAPLMKIQNTRMLGAEVVLEGDNYDEAYAAAIKLAKKTGRVFIHAFENADVIAGQGTCGLEILDQLPDVDAIIGSIGGGGLMSGVSVAIKESRPKIKLYGCQATGAPAMSRSIKSGKAIKTDRVETFADGIAVARASEQILPILRKNLEQCVEGGDEEIAAAVLTLLEKAKIVSEGAGALPLVAAEKLRSRLKGKNVVLIISGGNIDVNLLSRIIDRGLIRAGRRVRVNVLISDRPGSLARLTQLIATQGANILQAIHDRNEPAMGIDQTDVALTLETRGPEHSKEVIDALRKHVIRLDVLS